MTYLEANGSDVIVSTPAEQPQAFRELFSIASAAIAKLITITDPEMLPDLKDYLQEAIIQAVEDLEKEAAEHAQA